MKKKFNYISDKLVRKEKLLALFLLLTSYSSFAQPRPNPSTENWQISPGILGTFILVIIVLIIAFLILYMRINGYIDNMRYKSDLKNKQKLSEELIGLDDEEIDIILESRKTARKYQLSGTEISGENQAYDKRGIVSDFTHKRNRSEERRVGKECR